MPRNRAQIRSPVAEPGAAAALKSRAGHLQAVLAALCFSTAGFMTKRFEDAGGDPLTLILLRTLGGFVVFWGAVGTLGKRLPSRHLAVMGLCLGVFQLISSASLIIGFAQAPASLVILAFYVYPIPVVIAATLFLNEPLGWRRALLATMGISGLVLAIGPPESTSITGIALGATAGLGMACLVLGNRYLFQQGVSVAQVLALSYVGPTFALLVVFGAGVIPLPPARADALLPAFGLLTLSALIPIALFGLAVRRVGAATAAMLTTVEPFAAVVIAFLLLDESLTVVQIVGGFLIASAAALLSVLPAEGDPGAVSATQRRALTTRA